MRDQDNRRHLRYREPAGGTLHLVIQEGDSTRSLTGLTVNESHSGLACVYVGNPLPVGMEIAWQETKAIRTTCRVLRCQGVHPDVYLLALQILD